MDLTERTPGNSERLKQLAAAERDALRRDRYRAVILALAGKEAVDIAEALGRARRSVQDWAYSYRDGGIDAIQPKPRPGRVPKLPRDRESEFKTRLKAGPKAEDGVCTLGGKDVVRILEFEFGVKYSLGGAYDLLERLGYSCLTPRPLHEKSDPEAIAEFQTQAPFCKDGERCDRSTRRQSARLVHGRGTLWAAGHDHRCVGAARIPSLRGSPDALRLDLLLRCGGAGDRRIGRAAGAQRQHWHDECVPKILDAERKSDEHFVLIMDQAGWHRSRELTLPDGITVLLLPPYSPELNPVENLWHYLRSHYWSNRKYEDYDALLNAGTEAYCKLTPEVIKSVCRCPYLERADLS